MLTGQVVTGDPQGESSSTADVDSIIEPETFVFETKILIIDKNSFIF